MDKRSMPLGVFDSGLGGLTALRRLAEICPGEDIVYFGDTGRVPYGTKSAQTIKKYALEDAAFLQSLGVKAILVACGTVSANAMDELRLQCGDAVTGVIEPTVERAAAHAKEGGTVLILGTAATIASGAYEKALSALRPDLKIEKRACPMFVPLVENGYFDPENDAVKAIVRDYLAPYAGKADVAVLGCTHYPLLSAAISRALPGTVLVDSGRAAAEAIKAMLEASGLSSGKNSGSLRIYVSDNVPDFAHLASVFLGKTPEKVEKISVEGYRHDR